MSAKSTAVKIGQVQFSERKAHFEAPTGSMQGKENLPPNGHTYVRIPTPETGNREESGNAYEIKCARDEDLEINTSDEKVRRYRSAVPAHMFKLGKSPYYSKYQFKKPTYGTYRSYGTYRRYGTGYSGKKILTKGRKKTTYKKAYTSDAFSSTADMARKAWKMAKFVASLVNVEEKFLDTTAAGTTISTTAALTNLSLIAEGDDANQRAGRSIKATSHLFRGFFFMSASATRTVVRMILFIDNQYLSAMPAATDLLVTGDIKGAMNINTQSGGRFHVIMDKTYHLDYNGQQTIPFRYFHKLNHHIKYSGTTAANASGLSGQLILMLVSTEAINFASVDYTSRLRYVDN